MITIRLNGVDYREIISARVTTSVKTLCGAFSVTASANEDSVLPIKKGDRVQIMADLIPIVNGYVDSLTVSYDSGSHSITVTGRDVTQDVVDSTVGTRKEFKGGVGLVSIIEAVLSDLGLSSIKVINKAGDIRSFSSSEVTSAEIGQTAFEFIEPYCRKRQILLTTDGSGNIVLVKGNSDRAGINLVNLKADREGLNNILSASFTLDDSNRFRNYKIQAQGNPLFGLSSDSASVISQISSSATDSEVRASRTLEFLAEESMTAADCANRVNWEANLRRAESLKYSVTVQGHSANDTLWRFNQLVNVRDEFCDISAQLLISEVEYSFDLSSGSTSTLTLTYPDAYTLEANLNGLKSRTETIAPKFGI